MSGPACAALVDDGVIRGVLATVGCQTRAYAESGYLALTSGSGLFQTALTALLVIYVALMGFRLLFAQGQARISDLPVAALLIGAILALVTSWAAFQTLVFDLAERAPVEIAGVVAAPLQDARGASLAAHPVDGLQAAYDELTATGAAFGKVAGGAAKAYSSPEAAAAEAVSAATGVLFLLSAGVISAATLAIGVLTAVGPIFIALALVPATRGLFVGWVRALAAAALTPMVAWLLVVLMLAVLEPWLAALAEQRSQMHLQPQTAMSAAALVFVFGAGQLALVVGAWIMALGFRLPGLARERSVRTPAAAPAPQPVSAANLLLPSRAERLALDLQRDQAQQAARARSASLAAAVASPARAAGASEALPRLGEAYRRPAFAPRRAETAR
jgi:type IV secretion system protein VirB6